MYRRYAQSFSLYFNLCLHMGITGSPTIFQDKMTTLTGELEDVRTHIHDLLVITNGTFDDHFQKLEVVLNKVKKAKLYCNALKCGFSLLKK